MGLDFVELVLDVEEKFGICLPDRRFPALETAGDLHDLIVAVLFHEQEEPCLSRRAFYRVRRALTSIVGASRNEVRPATALDRLLPRWGRRRLWRRLRREIGVDLPALRFPRWLSRGFPMVALVAGLTAVAVLTPAIGLGHATVLVLAALVVGLLLGAWLAKPLATHLAPPCATVGGLAQQIVRMEYGALKDDQPKWRREEVWPALVALIAEWKALPPQQVTRSASLMKDLGFG